MAEQLLSNFESQPDPWAGDKQYSLLDTPVEDSMMPPPPDGPTSRPVQDIHDWTMDGAAAACSPQEMLDAALKLLFRSEEKMVDLRRIIVHLAEADAVMHSATANPEMDCLSQSLPVQQQPQRQQQHFATPQPGGRSQNLELLKKENQELKDINKQWHEFWTAQKRRWEQISEDRDHEMAQLRNQLHTVSRDFQHQQRMSPPSLPENPTESLIADTSEVVRRLERQRIRLEEDLARANRELEGLRQENEVLQAQAALFQEDFNRERADRESAQARMADLREQFDKQRLNGAAASVAAAAASPGAGSAPSGGRAPVAAPRDTPQPRHVRQQQCMLAGAVGGGIGGNSNVDGGSAIYDRLPVDSPRSSAVDGGPAAAAAVWLCGHCTLENPRSAAHCQACDKAKPQPERNPYLP